MKYTLTIFLFVVVPVIYCIVNTPVLPISNSLPLPVFEFRTTGKVPSQLLEDLSTLGKDNTDHDFLNACLSTIQCALEDSIEPFESSSLLIALSETPRVTDRLQYKKHFRGSPWQRVIGRLAVRSAIQNERYNLINAAWALTLMGHTYEPLLRSLRSSTIGSSGTLSVEEISRLVVIFQRAAVASSTSYTLLEPDLTLGSPYLQQLARLAESHLERISDGSTLVQVVEAIRVILYPLLHVQPVRQVGNADGGASVSSVTAPSGEAENGPPGVTFRPATNVIRATSEDGFNVYSFEEEEGVKCDTGHLAALVAAAAKGVDPAAPPTEPGIDLAAAQLQDMSLGELVRLSYSLLFLPQSTFTAKSRQLLDAEISNRWTNSRSSSSSPTSAADEEALGWEETVMLIKLWKGKTNQASPSFEVLTNSLVSSLALPTGNRHEEGVVIQECARLIESVKVLSDAALFNEQLVTTCVNFLNTHTIHDDATSSGDSLLGRISDEKQPTRNRVQFSCGVLQELLQQYEARTKRK